MSASTPVGSSSSSSSTSVVLTSSAEIPMHPKYALVVEAAKGNLVAVRTLIASGVDVNARVNLKVLYKLMNPENKPLSKDFRWRPIDSYTYQEACSEALVEPKGRQLTTAIREAISSDSLATVQLLLGAGADVVPTVLLNINNKEIYGCLLDAGVCFHHELMIGNCSILQDAAPVLNINALTSIYDHCVRAQFSIRSAMPSHFIADLTQLVIQYAGKGNYINEPCRYNHWTPLAYFADNNEFQTRGFKKSENLEHVQTLLNYGARPDALISPTKCFNPFNPSTAVTVMELAEKGRGADDDVVKLLKAANTRDRVLVEASSS